MTYKSLLLALVLMCFVGVLVRGDVAPEPGYTRVSMDLILKPKEDFPDYRFFTSSKMGSELAEIHLKAGEPKTIGPKGGGALYNSTTIYAIPKKTLSSVGTNPSVSELDALNKAVNEGRVAGIVKLVNHSFTADVLESDVDKYSDKVYSLERDGATGIKAVEMENPVAAGKTATGQGRYVSVSSDKSGSLPTVMAIGLLSFGIVLFGLWLTRRRGIGGNTK